MLILYDEYYYFNFYVVCSISIGLMLIKCLLVIYEFYGN